MDINIYEILLSKIQNNDFDSSTHISMGMM